VIEAVGSHRRSVPTARLNRIVHEAQQAHPHARVAGRARRILYAVQTDVAPPTLRLFATGALDASYLRYLENRLRAAEPFGGAPLRLEVRRKSQRDLEA
jgi:GTP-binding protein